MPNAPLARALLIFGVGAILLAVGVAAWLWTQPARQSVATGEATLAAGTALVGGPFELVDQNGRTRTEADFHGKYMLVYFGYTYCPDVCPTALGIMSRAIDALAETAPERAQRVVPIFITVDPERDTVAAMQAYAAHFHPALMALTGTAQQVARAAKSYRVYYAKAQDDAHSDYLMDHSGYIYLMGPEGAYLAHFGHATDAEQLATALVRYVGS